MVKPGQTEIIRIAHPRKRSVAFTKRYPTLFKKAGELAILTDSDVFLGVRSSTGRTLFCSYQGGKQIASNIDPHTGKVTSSTGPKEWEEGFVKPEFDACMNKKDLQSLIATYKASLDYAHEILGNWENNQSVKAGDSVVKVDRETEEMTDEGIGSILKSSSHVNCKSFFTSLLKRTAGGASDPTSSGYPFRLENSAIGGPSDPMSTGLDDGEFNMDELPNFSGPCIGDGHGPENLVIGGPSNPTSSDLDDWEFNTDDDLFRQENSAIGGPSNPTSSGLDDGQFNPDAFLDLSENYIGDGDHPENSASGGGYNPDDFSGLGDLDIPLDIRYF